MKVGTFVKHVGLSLFGVLVLAGLWSSRALAQHDQAHTGGLRHDVSSDQRNQSGDLVRIVRDATERYRDVAVADAEGYKLMFGCVAGPDSGAMGLHYVNMDLVMDPELDPTRPEIVIYEPTSNGRVRLIGADFLVFQEDWDAKGVGTPQIMGQLLHLFESPNRFGLKSFYTLHVWAWKDNPNGSFVNWHPKVSCDNFSGKN